jgi:pimeloyl-ACP methyl ester carboxylesterase
MSYQERCYQTPYTNFHTLVWGDQGPKVLLLHGFPETPHIFEKVAEGLLARGFQVFAPFLPGYGPTPPIDKNSNITHLDDLAHSLADLSASISFGDKPKKTQNNILNHADPANPKEQIILVGHDWGAVAAYVTAAYAPEGFSKLVTMAVPPLPIFLRGLMTQPRQLLRSNYMLLFQLRASIPERLLTLNDHYLLRKLCLKWSGPAKASQAYFSEHAAPFDGIDNLTPPLGYYRGILPLISGSWKKWRRSIELAFTQISIPCEILVGKHDGCIPSAIYEHHQSCFEQPSKLTIVEGAGHFLPLDAPNQVIAKIVN